VNFEVLPFMSYWSKPVVLQARWQLSRKISDIWR